MPPTGGTAVLSAALGMGRDFELLPWRLDSSVLPGNARSTPVSEGCLLAWPRAGRAAASSPFGTLYCSHRLLSEAFTPVSHGSDGPEA